MSFHRPPLPATLTPFSDMLGLRSWSVCCRYIHLCFKGLVYQVVSHPDDFPEAAAACQRLRTENVIKVSGTVRLRKDPNPGIPTGTLELAVEAVSLLNAVTQKLPFLPADDTNVPGEETRLRHRVLDLRCAFHPLFWNQPALPAQQGCAYQAVDQEHVSLTAGSCLELVV